MKTVLSLKFVRKIELSNAGGYTKARFAGKSSCVYGATAAEAIQRLEANALPSARVPRGAIWIKIQGEKK